MSWEKVIRRPRIVAILLMTLWATLLLRNALLPDYTIVPLDLIHTIAPWESDEPKALQNPLLSDPFYSFYPRRSLITESIRDGVFPLWNPYIMSGSPIVANPNFQLFYPPNLIAALFLPAHQALPWLAWFHLILTGMLMFLFLQRQGLHWHACLLGGTIWLLNGYGLVWLENPHRLSTAAWIPGLFWAFDTAVSQKSNRWAAIGGLMLGLAILGGQVQFIFALGLIFGVYTGTAVVQAIIKTKRLPWQIMLQMGLIALIGVGLGTLIVLPASEFSTLSQRTIFSPDALQNSRWGFNQLITLFAPDFYGNPIRSRYWGVNNYAEVTAYFGAAALVLGLTAPFVAQRRSFNGRVWLTTLAVASIISGSFVVRLFPLIPGGQFIVLTRLLFLVPLVGCWCAAIALDGWLNGAHTTPRKLLACGTAVLLIGIIFFITQSNLGAQFSENQQTIWQNMGRGLLLTTAVFLLLYVIPKWPQTAVLTIVFLAGADLLQWGGNFNPITSIDQLYPQNEVTQFLAQDNALYRVLPLQSEKVVFGPNVLSLYNQQTLGGYTPLILADYVAQYKAIDDDVAIGWMRPNRNMLVMSHFNPMVSLLNVKYVLAAHPLDFGIIPQLAHDECASERPLSTEPITQPFVATASGLNRLDVQIASIKETPESPIEFWLWRDEPFGELIAHHTLSPEELAANSYRPFFFAPVPDAIGQPFVWGMSGNSDVSLCQTSDGKLSFLTFGTWLQERTVVDGVWIYENPNVLPRAFLVHHIAQRPKERVIEMLHAPEFNYYQTAVLSNSLPREQEAQLSPEPVRSSSQVTVTNYQFHKVHVSVSTESAGLLVLADAFYPGWQAEINGRLTPIYQTNQTQRGVFVPEGTHEIVFRFVPTYLRTAVVVAIGSLLLALFFMTVGANIGRRSSTN